MKYYSPTGRRNHGRPLKRLLDTWDRNGSTSGLTPWQIYDDDDDDDNDILSRQPTPVILRICSNLAHFTQSNAFYPSMKQAHESSSTPNVRSDIILSIPAAYLLIFPLLNSNRFSPGTSLISLSVTFLCIRNIIFAVYAKITIVWLRKMNWTECGRKRLWPVLEYYTVIVCRD